MSALLAVAPCAPGLVARLSGSDILTHYGTTGVAFARVYDTAWFVSVTLGMVCCLGISRCFPRYQGLRRAPRDDGGGSKRGAGRFTRVDEAEAPPLRVSYS